jgi:hypothetical protein
VVTVGEILDAIKAGDQRTAIATGLLRLKDREGNESSYGLQNLAQTLAMAPTGDWSHLVAEHFEAMLTVDRPPESATEALSALRVRMWHTDFVKQSPEAVHRVLAPGLVLALVVDLPKKVMSASAAELAGWGLSEEEAWKAGEENSKRESFEIVPQTGPGGIEMLFFMGDNLYVTSHALCLDEHIRLEADNGALLGIPTRHLLVVVPIHAVRDLQAVSGMHAANRKIFDEGPGSISPELFWWRRGSFTLFPIDASVQPMQATPPDAFVEMLERLAAREKLQ